MIIEWCVTCECCDTDVIVSAAWFKRVLDGQSIVVCERCVPDYERATGNRAVDMMEAS